jgi:hypothetical protein
MKLPSIIFLLCTMATLLAAAPVTSPNDGHAKSAREAAFKVSLPATEAFKLFEPIGEKQWAEGWNPVFASPADALLHDGSVFTVEGVHPKGGPLHSVWTVSRYEPPRLIEYRNVLVDLRATRIRVSCAALGEKETQVTVNYEYTGLSKDGDEFVAHLTSEHFKAMIAKWDESIATFLAKVGR